MFRSKLEVKNLEGLQYVEAGDTNSPDKIILFHGYGADMYDLYSLSEVIKTRKNFHWIFPNGILDVPIGPMMSGKAWFPVSVAAFEQSIASGEFSRRVPQGLENVRARVEKFLRALKCDFARAYIGGFSQGSMLTVDLMCETDIFPKGVVLLSSTLVNKDRWTSKMNTKKGLKFYQSHGEGDTVLPLEFAQMLYENLEKHGWDGHLTTFPGGHEIPANVIRELASFLQ